MKRPQEHFLALLVIKNWFNDTLVFIDDFQPYTATINQKMINDGKWCHKRKISKWVIGEEPTTISIASLRSSVFKELLYSNSANLCYMALVLLDK